MEVVRNSYLNFVQFLKKILEKTSLVIYIALICVFVIYFCSVESRFSKFYCLLQNDKISSFTGFVKSNPVLTSSGKYYMCDFSPYEVSSFDENEKFSSLGKVKLLLPKNLVESHFPGKLYSSSGKTIFIETGAKLLVKIKPSKKSSTSISSTDNFFIVSDVDFLGWINFVSKIRGILRLQFKRLMYMWGSAGGLLLALLSASKEYTSAEFSESFRLAGLSHILALSGMHVSIFSGITEKTFKNIFGKNKTQLISLFSVILFVWFAGLSPSLARALISTIILFLIKKIGIKMEVLEVLCLSFLIQISILPQDSSAISFILSYLALFGILTFGEFFKPSLTKFLGSNLATSVSASVGAVVMTSPISAFIWGYITPIGIISTIIISPLVTFFLVFGLISVILCLIFPFLSYPLGTILQIVYYIIEYIAFLFAKVPPIIL